MKRIALNKNREVNRLDLEKIEFHNKVRQTFLDLAKKYEDRYVIIDASKPLVEVNKSVEEAIARRLKEK